MVIFEASSQQSLSIVFSIANNKEKKKKYNKKWRILKRTIKIIKRNKGYMKLRLKILSNHNNKI